MAGDLEAMVDAMELSHECANPRAEEHSDPRVIVDASMEALMLADREIEGLERLLSDVLKRLIRFLKRDAENHVRRHGLDQLDARIEAQAAVMAALARSYLEFSNGRERPEEDEAIAEAVLFLCGARQARAGNARQLVN